MSLIFISNLVPDCHPYNGLGYSASGNKVALGIAESIPESEDPIFLTCRPIASFPKGPLWIKSECVEVNKIRLYILPTLNIKIIKGLYWGLKIKKYIKKWAKNNKLEERKVLVYNIYNPPISQLYKVCKKTSSRLYAILYDLGIPPTHLNLSKLTMLGYKGMEKMAYKYIPKLDGRIVINERIIQEYSPNKDYILIDGGLSSQTIDLLPQLQKREFNNKLVLTLAGMLWEQNGTKLILSCLEQHPELNVIVCFAGSGIDVGVIEANAQKDKRIRYFGSLSQEELFNLYEISDVLLNLRIEEPNDMHFPSKLLEYMATGKHVISTSVAHAKRDYGNFITVLDSPTVNNLYDAIISIQESDPETIYNQGILTRNYMKEKRSWKARTEEILNYMKQYEKG